MYHYHYTPKLLRVALDIPGPHVNYRTINNNNSVHYKNLVANIELQLHSGNNIAIFIHIHISITTFSYMAIPPLYIIPV